MAIKQCINLSSTDDFPRWKQSVNHMFCAQTQVTWSRPQTPPISLALSILRLQIQVQEPALPVQIGQRAGGRAAGVDRIPWGRAPRPFRLPLAVPFPLALQILGRTQVWRPLASALLLNTVSCSFSSNLVFNHDGAAAPACSRSYWIPNKRCDLLESWCCQGSLFFCNKCVLMPV